MKFKFTFLLFIVIIVSVTEMTQAQTTSEELAPVVVKSSESKLVADKSKMNNEQLAVDSLLMKIGLEAEEDMFPSDDLYGSWTNTHVKAYSNVTVPDSFSVDLSEFTMPFKGKITSKFGWRRRRFHYGTDIKLQVGDTVYAAFDGKVRVKRFERRGYGNFIVLRHANGLETVYGHLSHFLVDQEETVKAGQPIGLGGYTGRSYGSHLHFEFRFLGNAINPEEIIDFENFCTKDELYVFMKGQSGHTSSNPKYAAQSDEKIKYYRIKNGDTLGLIAHKTGTSVNRLCKLNNIRPTTVLKIGRSIRIS